MTLSRALPGGLPGALAGSLVAGDAGAEILAGSSTLFLIDANAPAVDPRNSVDAFIAFGRSAASTPAFRWPANAGPIGKPAGVAFLSIAAIATAGRASPVRAIARSYGNADTRYPVNIAYSAGVASTVQANDPSDGSFVGWITDASTRFLISEFGTDATGTDPAFASTSIGPDPGQQDLTIPIGWYLSVFNGSKGGDLSIAPTRSPAKYRPANLKRLSVPGALGWYVYNAAGDDTMTPGYFNGLGDISADDGMTIFADGNVVPVDWAICVSNAGGVVTMRRGHDDDSWVDFKL